VSGLKGDTQAADPPGLAGPVLGVFRDNKPISDSGWPFVDGGVAVQVGLRLDVTHSQPCLLARHLAETCQGGEGTTIELKGESENWPREKEEEENLKRKIYKRKEKRSEGKKVW
jgi:hypothetical protein